MEELEGGDITFTDMVDKGSDLHSPVKAFYEGSTLFLTGATGFMGKVMIEKLLRSCPGIEQIYILARAKKGKEISKRFEEQFSDPLYDRLRREQPNFMSKLTFIPGDVGLLGLGISKDDYEIISKKINIIFHIAATVRFDERLQLAVRINVRGTQEALSLARNCNNLKAFLHVSTAFSNCIVKNIDEKFYDPPITAEKIMSLVESLDEEVVHKITPTLLGEFPNTYAYTKVIAENVIKEMSKGLPVAMIRPSIIVATAKEPVQGWIDNIYGPTGVVVGAGLGLLHTLHCDPDVYADIIPVDYVINACLVATYEIARLHENPNKEKIIHIENDTHAEESTKHPVPIYNYVSSTQKPIKWRSFMSYIEKFGLEVPTMLAIWVYNLKLNKNYMLHMLYVYISHIIPAYIVDGFAYIFAKKQPRLVKAYEKIHKFSSVIAYFCTQKWYFHTQNTQDLCKILTKGDEKLFDFDITHLNWEEYFYTYIRGIRVYLIKDSLDTIEQAKKRYRLLQLGHYTLCTTTILGLLRIIWLVIQFLR